MRRIKIKILNVFLVILIGVSSMFVSEAQPTGDRNKQGSWAGGGNFEKPEIELSGKIIDENTKAPLEFATIAFYSKKDSSLTGGGITSVNGDFKVKSKVGKLYAVIEFLGYDKKQLNDVAIDFEQIKSGIKNFDLGIIELGNEGINLEEVEVVAEKSETTFALDKKVFTVGKDLANKGGTAEEILDNVPSVTVDIEGEVSLRGSTGVRILVDGRPSTLGDNLKSIPAGTIESVEVITNPSARYEAEGQAGIINIILKKSRGSGFNGSFDLTAGFPFTAGLGANVNYRKGKVNWFANCAVRHRENMGGGISESIFYDAGKTGAARIDTFSNSNRDRNRAANTINVRLGGEYFFNNKESLTAALRYKISDDNNINTVFYKDYTVAINPDNLFRTVERTEEEHEDETGLEYSLNYRKQFSDNRKHALSVTASYEDDLEKEYSDFYETVDRFVQDTMYNFFQRSNIDEGTKTWLLQADYIKPIAKDHQYELGAKGSFRNVGNDYSVEDSMDIWKINEAFTNVFNYDELILAGYGQYGNKFGPFSFQAGLRVEHTQIETRLDKQNLKNDTIYTNLFPSAFLNYEIDATNAIQINYSRRISRPRFFTLNPFITYADRRSVFKGNPNLTPEYTDSYELNYLRFWEKATLSAGLFYRHSRDVNQRIRYRVENEQVENDSIDQFNTVIKPYNIGIRDDIGLDVNISYSGLKWLRLDANANFFNIRSPMDSINISENEENEKYELLRAVDDFTWTARLTSKITFWKNTDLQLRFNYRGPSETAQGERKGIYSLDVGCSKDLLKSKNLTATISIRDLLNSRKRKGTTYSEGYENYSEFRWRSRTGTITLNYRINQKKRFGKGRGGYNGGGDFDGGF